MVGARGFEPPASCSRSKRSTKLSYAPSCGAREIAAGPHARKWVPRQNARCTAKSASSSSDRRARLSAKPSSAARASLL
jgi:hypothetical protein